MRRDPAKAVTPQQTSPSHVMCLIGSRGNLVVYLNKDWVKSRRVFTTDIKQAWTCASAAEGSSMVSHVMEGLPLAKTMGVFQLRKFSSCPSVIKLG